MKFEAAEMDIPGLSLREEFSDLAPSPDGSPAEDGPARMAYEAAEIRSLRCELDRLRAEREKLLDTQRVIMDLLHTASPDKILHDLRNVLNERELYRALADIDSLQD